MKYLTLIVCLFLSGVAQPAAAGGKTPDCVLQKGVTLQILGSGGPIADDARASSGYLVWIDGHARILIDAGGGTFLRFGEAGADFADLLHIGISHFHTDHSADLVALLKSGYFSGRTNSLSISGPAGGNSYPGLDEYLHHLLDAHNGAYAYLAGYLDGSDGLVQLATTVVDPLQTRKQPVYRDQAKDIEIFALGVPHGPVPALAYRVRVGEHSMVFSGDQNGRAKNFVEFAKNADMLVMHMPVPEGIRGVGLNLHAPPSLIGHIADATAPKKLVLSHFMARSLEKIEDNLNEVQARYSGIIVTAKDLQCVTLDFNR